MKVHSLKSYAIKNNGANTSFSELPRQDEPLPAIAQFDQFQENFLKNYTTYCADDRELNLCPKQKSVGNASPRTVKNCKEFITCNA